jgi:predicted HTH transcriptional regulator
MGLIVPGGTTNACVLLYAKVQPKYFPQARARLIVMPKGENGRPFLPLIGFSRPAFSKPLGNCLMRLHRTWVGSAVNLRIGIDRTTRYTHLQLLREGVMNALVHRDYELTGAVTIFCLRDSIRISNPGGLPLGLEPAGLS